MGGGLRAGDIVEDAVAATGITDVGDDWFMTPLTLWAHDLEQPDLNDRGRRFLRSLAVRDVSRRLRVLATLRDHPEIGDVELPPIVYITGLERSGTTVLHNLVALHRSSGALLRWELMEPVPPPTTASYGTDPRIAAVQAGSSPKSTRRRRSSTTARSSGSGPRRACGRLPRRPARGSTQRSAVEPRHVRLRPR